MSAGTCWPTRSIALLAGLPDGTVRVLHPFVCSADRPECVAVTASGCEFASAVEQDNVFGVQFHPEKSGKDGVQSLENFVAIARRGA